MKNSGNALNLAAERGDHIVPNFEEIWPSKKKQEEKERAKDASYNYYLDAMKNGPQLPGHLPIPSNFTTVGKPQIFVNQYDSPLECYSEVRAEGYPTKQERPVLARRDFFKLTSVTKW